MVFVTILLSKRLVIVPDNWIENTAIRIFFSPDSNAQPNFHLDEKFLFNKNAAQVCRDYVLKKFHSVVAAEKYIENKRPVLPVKYDKEDYNKVRVTFDGTPLEHIDLSSDLESEDEAPEEMLHNELVRPNGDDHDENETGHNESTNNDVSNRSNADLNRLLCVYFVHVLVNGCLHSIYVEMFYRKQCKHIVHQF